MFVYSHRISQAAGNTNMAAFMCKLLTVQPLVYHDVNGDLSQEVVVT